MVFLFVFMVIYVVHDSIHSYSSFVLTARKNLEFGCTISHSYSARQKAFYVLTIADNAFWPGDSCLDQPRFHLRFSDDVMPTITSTISHNFALSNQRLTWRSGMSFALHQSGHRFAHIFMFAIFPVVRFSLALCQYSYPSKQ